MSAPRRVSLARCPIGLFLYSGELCLKTEYGNNEGRIDAYIVSSGEFFWGDAPQTIASQRAQLVVPVRQINADLVFAARDLHLALVAAVKVADEARDEWDAAPAGMKAGKLLIALSGRLTGYRADIDAIHAALAKAEGRKP